MNSWIVKYRVALFYAFAFVISWPSWFLMSLVNRGGGAFDSSIVGFSPGGGAVPPLSYLLVLAFSTLGGLGPLLSLAILERLSGKDIRVNKVLSKIQIREARKGWFIPAIFALPIVTILGNLINSYTSRVETLRLSNPGPGALGFFVLPIIAIHFTASLITSPLFEEPGWRGFALGELQGKFGRQVPG